MDIDYETKQVKCRKAGSDEIDIISYDALINTAPIDLLVQNTKICPELNVEHNKVRLFSLKISSILQTF